jgi:hypothetical protein
MRPGAKYVVVCILQREKWAERQYACEWLWKETLTGTPAH